MKFKLDLLKSRPWGVAVLAFLLLMLISLLITLTYALKVTSGISKLTLSDSQIPTSELRSIDMDLKKFNFFISNPILHLGAVVAFSGDSYNHVKEMASNAGAVTSLIIAKQDSGGSSNINLNSVELLGQALPYIDAGINSFSQLRLRGLLYPFDSKLQPFRLQAEELHQVSSKLAPLAPVLTNLMGSDSPKNYLLAFQNSAESRGTGGILGAYAILTFKKGNFLISRSGANSNLRSAQDIPIQMPSEYVKLYNDDPGIWQNSNLSPHFPYGAKIWLALWERQFNQKLDGVITFDPVALSSMLEFIGPIVINERTITAENVVSFTLSDIYRIYANDNQARKQFLVSLIQGLSTRIATSQPSNLSLARSLIKPLLENRILLFSSDAQSQKIIEKSSISGALSSNIDNEYRLVVQNISGNKMDYYLDRTVKLKTIKCYPRRTTQITFSLTNKVKDTKQLPSYVKGRLDLDKPNGDGNSNGVRAMVIAPIGSHLISMKEGKTESRMGFFLREVGHPGIGIDLSLKAGEKKTFTLAFTGGKGKLTTVVQPLVNDQKTSLEDWCTDDK